MELTRAAVDGRIADLHSLATELRIARVARAAPRPPATQPSKPSERGSWLGGRLIGLGTALGGNPAEARRQPIR